MKKVRLQSENYFWTFIVLCFVGGFIGLQEFYRKKWVLGILAVLFWWTFIPTIVAFIEGIVALFKSYVYLPGHMIIDEYPDEKEQSDSRMSLAKRYIDEDGNDIRVHKYIKSSNNNDQGAV